MGSNHRPPPCQGGALPLSYAPDCSRAAKDTKGAAMTQAIKTRGPPCRAALPVRLGPGGMPQPLDLLDAGRHPGLRAGSRRRLSSLLRRRARGSRLELPETDDDRQAPRARARIALHHGPRRRDRLRRQRGDRPPACECPAGSAGWRRSSSTPLERRHSARSIAPVDQRPRRAASRRSHRPGPRPERRAPTGGCAGASPRAVRALQLVEQLIDPLLDVLEHRAAPDGLERCRGRSPPRAGASPAR